MLLLETCPFVLQVLSTPFVHFLMGLIVCAAVIKMEMAMVLPTFGLSHTHLHFYHSRANFLTCTKGVNKIMARLAFYLFVSSNNTTKQPDDTSDIGQLVSYYSCDMLQTTPPSQICTIETILFRLV